MEVLNEILKFVYLASAQKSSSSKIGLKQNKTFKRLQRFEVESEIRLAVALSFG